MEVSGNDATGVLFISARDMAVFNVRTIVITHFLVGSSWRAAQMALHFFQHNFDPSCDGDT